jgi:hypothetical protein
MKNKIDRYVACMEERISAYKVLVEKPEELWNNKSALIQLMHGTNMKTDS